MKDERKNIEEMQGSLSKEQKQKNLWRLCFHDSENFIEHFFKQFGAMSNARTVEADNEVVASLHLLPYFVSFYGERLSGRYIYGVCTHPDYRRRGMMTKLLDNLIEEFNGSTVQFLFLVPAEEALFDVYRKFGFTEAFYVEEKRVIVEHTPKHPESIQSANVHMTSVQEYLEKKLQEYPVSILQTDDNLQFVVDDARTEGGECFFYREGGRIRGMAVALPQKDEIYLAELQTDTEDIRNELLAYIAQKYGHSTLLYREPATQKTGRPFGMVRITHLERLSKIWQGFHPERKLTTEEFMRLNHRRQVEILFDTGRNKNYMSMMMD